MASPQSARLAITPAPSTPASRAWLSPLSDDSIWKRLREAGFDEESIKRRDKAALIAYIAKLEAELYEHQHHMGLLIMEKKDWLSKYDQVTIKSEAAELMYKREQAAHSASLLEAKKREDNLKKALGIEKECVANIEKALHEMRAESAETKVSAENKLVEARNLMEVANKKLSDSEVKIRAAESLEAESSRYHRAAERKLHEVEAREDDLRRRTSLFKSDCDAKEKELHRERQSLNERIKTLQQAQERLLDGQASLNQREDYIFHKSEELSQSEKKIDDLKLDVEKERIALRDEKTELELKEASLLAREEALMKREYELNKKEEDLLITREKLAAKEAEGIQKVMLNHEAALKAKKIELESELDLKRRTVEDEIENKRRAWELREVDLGQRVDLISEKEHNLEIQSRIVSDREKDLTEKLNSLEEREKSLLASEREVEQIKMALQKEKEDVSSMKLDLENSLNLLEEKKRDIDRAEEKFEAKKSETGDLVLLEVRLKEEIDMIRDLKKRLEEEADDLKAEKARFEVEWESIDEKREELRKEAERLGEERLVISKFLKDERDTLKIEKDIIRDQYKRDLESLSRDREAFMTQMEQERSEWFNRIQKERADFLKDFEMQKVELENCIEKRREEIEGFHKEKEKAFEEEKKKEIQYIDSLRETVVKETEQVNLEMVRLENERREINLEREKRDKEWAEINQSIEELKIQRIKLEKQRESLHIDREEILTQIAKLKELEDLKAVPDRITAIEILDSDIRPKKQRGSGRRVSSLKQIDSDSGQKQIQKQVEDSASKKLSTPLSWLKRCADSLLEPSSNKKRKHQPEVVVTHSEQTTNRCITSTQTEEDENGAKETTVYIDKIITVTTVDGLHVTGETKFVQNQEEAISNGELTSGESGKMVKP